MSVPTITTIAPAAGPTGGRQLVTITGTNFRLPTPYAGTGVAPVPDPTVSVTFGGVAATDVQVAAATEVTCLTPVGDHGVAGAPKACAVVVSNLDDDGDVIAGEVATRATGYTYQLAKLTVASDLERVTKTLIAEFARQVCPTAVTIVDTDYDSDTVDGLNIPDTAKQPCVVIQGPQMVHAPQWGEASGGVIEDVVDATHANLRAPAVWMDLIYAITVITDSTATLHRLMADGREFLRRAPTLPVLRDASDATQGYVEFQIWPTEEPRNTTVPRLSNLKTFTFGVIVHGVPLEGTRGDDDALVVAKTTTAETIDTSPEQLEVDTVPA